MRCGVVPQGVETLTEEQESALPVRFLLQVVCIALH